jgi:hypothetical protein
MAVFRDKFQKIIQKFANLNLIDLEEKLKKDPVYQLESLKLANLSSLDKKDIEKRINFIENFSEVKLNYITEKN